MGLQYVHAIMHCTCTFIVETFEGLQVHVHVYVTCTCMHVYMYMLSFRRSSLEHEKFELLKYSKSTKATKVAAYNIFSCYMYMYTTIYMYMYVYIVM